MNERDKWKQKLKEIKINSPGILTPELEEANKNFKLYRNKVNNMKKHDENKYKRKIYEENKHSSQLTWKISKKFMNWKSSGSPHQIKSNISKRKPLKLLKL